MTMAGVLRAIIAALLGLSGGDILKRQPGGPKLNRDEDYRLLKDEIRKSGRFVLERPGVWRYRDRPARVQMDDRRLTVTVSGRSASDGKAVSRTYEVGELAALRHRMQLTQAPPQPRVYTVHRGDSLWAIAQTHYGSENEWPKIYRANRKVIGTNPNRIHPGQKLVIP